MYTLICEGACNPTIHEHDAAVHGWNAQRDGVRGVPLPPEIIRWTQAATYTGHTSAHPNAAKCVVCGTVRRYGA